MKKQTKKSSDNRIVYLDNDEITDPIKVVHVFFQSLLVAQSFEDAETLAKRCSA